MKGEPELMLDMLSSSQLSVTFLPIGRRRPMLSRCISWATLRLKPLVTSKDDGPFSGWVLYGFWGEPWAMMIPLTSSIDLLQV